jgi:hypothetical protein
MSWALLLFLLGGGVVEGVNLKPVKANIPPRVRINTRLNPAYIEAVAKRAKWGKRKNEAGTAYYNYVVDKKIKTRNPEDIKIGVVKIKAKRLENSKIQNLTYYKNLDIKVQNPKTEILQKLHKKKEVDVGTLELKAKNIKNKKIKVYNYIENLKIH